LEALETLEQKILKLLGSIGKLKRENKGLDDKIKEKEEETRGLKQEIKNLLAERDQVKQKVAELIKRMEEF